MHNKRTWIEKFSDFVSGKGFYLVVLICVAAIALSGYYLVRGVRGGIEDTLDQPVAGSAAIIDRPAPTPSARPAVKPTDPPAQVSVQATLPPAASAAPAPSERPAPSTAPSAAPTRAPAPLVFTWPVKGEIIAGLSVETLAYSETMGDWRTHEGIDIAAPLGTQVLCQPIRQPGRRAHRICGRRGKDRRRHRRGGGYRRRRERPAAPSPLHPAERGLSRRSGGLPARAITSRKKGAHILGPLFHYSRSDSRSIRFVFPAASTDKAQPAR